MVPPRSHSYGRGPLVPFSLGFLAALMLVAMLGRGRSAGEAEQRGAPGRSLLTTAAAASAAPASPAGIPAGRKKVLAVVGVQTGFTTDPHPKYNYEKRRQALRNAWFPKDLEAMDRLEEEHGIVIRFVVGHSRDALKEAAMNEEAARHGGFWRLPVEEAYLSLANKTLIFFSEAAKKYDAEYIVKLDDDVYFRLDRLPHAIKQWRDIHADYIGCMKTGVVIKSPRQRWYEPQHVVLGGSGDTRYFTHAWGPVYVVAGQVAEDFAVTRPGSLRFFNNEDVTVGSWMLSRNVTHYDDRRLCENRCSHSSLAVYDIPGCAGLCDPVKQLPELHNSSECHLPTTTPTGGLPLTDPMFIFDRRPDPQWEASTIAQIKRERRNQVAAMQRLKREQEQRQQQQRLPQQLPPLPQQQGSQAQGTQS